MITDIIGGALLAIGIGILIFLAVKMRREYRQALAALARPVDGQPLNARSRLILAAIERDTEHFPVGEPGMPGGVRVISGAAIKARPCMCGCIEDVHRHYRAGSDCSRCRACRRYRRRNRLRRALSVDRGTA